MLFNVGDRVVAKPGNYRAIGKDNIGTITEVVDGHYVINWDHPGTNTYPSGSNNNQWNMGYSSVELYEVSITPHYKIIRKIKQMEDRRKANGYSF